jgi:C_GCAxxG_C_C family probable redox protein
MKTDKQPLPDPQDEARHPLHEISRKIGERAGNLFQTGQLWCSGAALVALNHALGGDLAEELAVRLTSGLSDGMGGSGCLCGALNGGALALGLFLGTGCLSTEGDQRVLKATRELQDRFKAAFGSTCCRSLVKGHDNVPGKDHGKCALRTAKATEFAAALILHRHPELSRRIDWGYLNQKEGIVKTRLKIAARRVMGRSPKATANPERLPPATDCRGVEDPGGNEI